MGGREEDVVGRMVRVGVGLFFRVEEWMCNLWKMDGLLGGVELVDSPGEGSRGAAPALSVNNLGTVVVTLQR
jgi:hypothetical protein